nr:alpha/beta hydrolase [Nocardia bovistercoris]
MLLLVGGDGDADAYDRVSAELDAYFTVVTHDRRGLSRSTRAVTDDVIADHADDAAAVLAAVTDEPAFVFGSSIGGVIALELLARHPHAVRMAVVHEPPIATMLPEPGRTEFTRAQLEVEAAFRADDIPAAMGRFARLVQLDPADHEPEVTPRPAGANRPDNLRRFLGVDAPAVRRYRLDRDALDRDKGRVVAVVGATTTGVVAQCAHTLGAAIGARAVTFPGGHTGPTQHPRAVGRALRGLLLDGVAGVGGQAGQHAARELSATDAPASRQAHRGDS